MTSADRRFAGEHKRKPRRSKGNHRPEALMRVKHHRGTQVERARKAIRRTLDAGSIELKVAMVVIERFETVRPRAGVTRMATAVSETHGQILFNLSEEERRDTDAIARGISAAKKQLYEAGKRDT